MVWLYRLPGQDLFLFLFLFKGKLYILHPSLRRHQATLFFPMFLLAGWKFNHINRHVSRRRRKIPLRIDAFRGIALEELNGISNMEIDMIWALFGRWWGLTGSGWFKPFIIWEWNVKRVNFFLSDIHILLNFNSQT